MKRLFLFLAFVAVLYASCKPIQEAFGFKIEVQHVDGRVDAGGKLVVVPSFSLAVSGGENNYEVVYSIDNGTIFTAHLYPSKPLSIELDESLWTSGSHKLSGTVTDTQTKESVKFEDVLYIKGQSLTGLHGYLIGDNKPFSNDRVKIYPGQLVKMAASYEPATLVQYRVETSDPNIMSTDITSGECKGSLAVTAVASSEKAGDVEISLVFINGDEEYRLSQSFTVLDEPCPFVTDVKIGEEDALILKGNQTIEVPFTIYPDYAQYESITVTTSSSNIRASLLDGNKISLSSAGTYPSVEKLNIVIVDKNGSMTTWSKDVRCMKGISVTVKVVDAKKAEFSYSNGGLFDFSGYQISGSVSVAGHSSCSAGGEQYSYNWSIVDAFVQSTGNSIETPKLNSILESEEAEFITWGEYDDANPAGEMVWVEYNTHFTPYIEKYSVELEVNSLTSRYPGLIYLTNSTIVVPATVQVERSSYTSVYARYFNVSAKDCEKNIKVNVR